ncbi:DUF58 domain-containing protein [Candidatus Gracilibacteria bacterium]|nr:DUF58 domain-containing protein [Candidatus Gracilibacteria bacterium]
MNHLQDFRKLDIKTKKMISSNLAGNFKSAFRGRGLEFDEFKEYEAGEDSRYIDWLVSAREQRLLTKKFSLDKSIKVFFVLDLTKSMDFGIEKKKQDTLLEAFFLLALSSIENTDDVGALIFDENRYKFFEPKKGKSQIFEIYRSIMEMNTNSASSVIKHSHSVILGLDPGISSKVENLKNTKDTNIFKSIFSRDDKKNISESIDSGSGPEGQFSELVNLNSILSFLMKIKLKNTMLFFLTDKMQIQDYKELKVLALKNDLVFVNIFDNFENTLTLPKEYSGVLGLDSIFGEGIFVDLSDKEKKDEYIAYRKDKINMLSWYINSIKASYLKIDNLSNIYSEFFNFFSKK